MVGNTEIAVRDGMVLSNLYGGSEASTLYGSTQIIVGWPQYYVCQKSGRYKLNRNDKISKAALNPGMSSTDNVSKAALLQEIWLREGEYVSPSVYRTLHATDQPYIEGFGSTLTLEDCFTFVANDYPQNYKEHYNSSNVDYHTITWDDIDIYIGNGKSRRDTREEYLAHGNIYGGGFITSNSSQSLAGQFTVQKFRNGYWNDPADEGFGGNSSIIIWDNIENANTAYDIGGKGASGATIKDHITIGTGHYVEAKVYAGMDVIGKYRFVKNANGKYDDPEGSGDKGNYVHQPSYVLQASDLAEGGDYYGVKFYEIESDGGIYGGGRKVYVEGFRSCDLAYYGYADYTPQYPKLLNSAQRLNLFSITDCCLFFEGANDFATNSLDATNYSLTRIGELQMNSSIPATEELDPGTRENSGMYNTIHNLPRKRNYIAFFHDVLYVAGITSNQLFTDRFRGANGQFNYTEDYAIDADDNKVNQKSNVPAGADYKTPAEEFGEKYSYKQYKTNRINNYYANRNLPVKRGDVNYNSETSDELIANNTIRTLTSLEFDQRNIGTAANMIGINNGYTLKIQGEGVMPDETDATIYYGPVNGVFEIKLMTLAKDEGGGYIYALNQHDDPNHFLETTGNFVFPGAAYKVNSDGTSDYNYVYDDCFPMGSGWDSYYGWPASPADYKTSTMPGSRASTVTVDEDHGDCNALEDVHYWYVSGTNYYYNVTLTGYTFNDKSKFTLNNNDYLIYLYGVGDGSEITLDTVTWEPIATTSTYSSDLQNITDKDTDGNYVKDYKIYITVDGDPSTAHDVTSTQSATGYAVMLPRADRTRSGAGTTADPYVYTTADALAKSIGEINNYKEKDKEGNLINKPLLGISLFDNIDNSTSTYYKAHLEQDEKVRIVLTTLQTSDDGTVTPFTYTINLTIQYLLGPVITGNPVIENDALPGEYIFANDFGVDVELDDANMAVTGRNWYIQDPTGATKVNVTDQTFGGSNGQVHIPAYLYRDGWNLIYEVVTNSGPIPLYTVAPTEDSPERQQLTVHNYHRMLPSINETNRLSTMETIPLTAGSRIYIEDEDDLAYFFEWLEAAQSAPTTKTENGLEINPQYGEGLTFYLMDDLKMPEIAKSNTSAVENLVFRGTFHGGGHSIDMGENLMFLGYNQGAFYNTGFIAEKNAVVFGYNGATDHSKQGTIESCFFYNSTDISKGELIGERGYGVVYNSFVTSTTKGEVDGLYVATKDEFDYGKVAYNLNHFYLKKRYNLATSTPDGNLVAPINDDYRDGSYRYARVYDADSSPWSLRTATTPNYRDLLKKRSSITATAYPTAGVTGADATMHNTLDPIDELRGLDENGNNLIDADGKQYYLPVYPTDYIFFGQDLAYGSTEDPWPHSISETERVYRASGFYGSEVDKGFHFNLGAAAVEPSLTAIDFVGVRDAAYSESKYNKGDYQDGYSVSYDERTDRSIWYAPALDLPDKEDLNLGLTSFTTATIEEAAVDLGESPVTRNLLIYAPEAMSGAGGLLQDWKYDTDKAATDIYGHVIDATAAASTTDYLQLVDKEDFNCPIPITVTEKVWYSRIPEVFSTGGDAWEGLCLPFTVKSVYGSIENPEMGTIHDHGEMTHFYGTHAGKDVKAESHEYWLRKFVGVDGDKAYFVRPGSEDDLGGTTFNHIANLQESTEDIHYSNLYFSTLYGDDYNFSATHDKQAAAYTAEGVDYDDYPYITATYPYIISFPGKRYYEFDCSGEFYAERFNTSSPGRQVITYSAPGQKILVTDHNQPKAFSHDAYSHVGTFTHATSKSNEVVIDEEDNAGSLVRKTDYVVYPFRTYLAVPVASTKPLYIASRGVDSLVEDEDGDDEAGELLLTMRVEDNELVIDNQYDYDITLTVYDIQGRYARQVRALHESETRVADLPAGYYIVKTFKFRIN